MTTTPQQALGSIEKFLAANPDLATRAPKQAATLKTLQTLLKQPKAAVSDEVKRAVGELYHWSLDSQRADYSARLDAVTKAHAKTPGPALEKTKVAFGEMVKFLDEAKRAGFPVAEAAAKALGVAQARVEKAFAEARAAASVSAPAPASVKATAAKSAAARSTAVKAAPSKAPAKPAAKGNGKPAAKAPPRRR